MKQTTETGRAATRFARENYLKAAAFIGAKILPGSSNNAIWKNKKVNIKSAKLGNTQIGATVNNLAWADSIIAIIQISKDLYEIFEVSTDWYQKEMGDSRLDYNKFVSCAKICEQGNKIGIMPT